MPFLSLYLVALAVFIAVNIFFAIRYVYRVIKRLANPTMLVARDEFSTNEAHKPVAKKTLQHSLHKTPGKAVDLSWVAAEQVEQEKNQHCLATLTANEVMRLVNGDRAESYYAAKYR